ncbi:hypothetical protein B0J13DRAFT_637820 [Dactylonectria estremocensis]|uniref:RelA/SpoT domain-containing protein n=1 Tax=Dactylonectria estremocensis TaxID=1079267 RepID=A0A9P9ENG8_9HYPO|nr:hypothetical protein B0J13DRAFT_637820 [Dactylonectria estremocensis]
MTPLYEKLKQHIHDAPCDEPVKVVFTDIWMQLKSEYDHMVKDLVQYLQNELDQGGIVAFIEGRAKTVDSVTKSIERQEAYRMREKGQDEYRNLTEILGDLHDLAAVRIVLDYRDDTDTVNKLISSTFRHISKPNVFSRTREVGSNWNTWFGAYESWNHHVRLKPATTVEDLLPYCDITFEVQLTTLSESLYNKLAHPLIYKQSSGALSREQEMMVDVAHGSVMIMLCALCACGRRRTNARTRYRYKRHFEMPRGKSSEMMAPGDQNPLAGQTMSGKALLAAASPSLANLPSENLQLISNAVRTALHEIKKTPPICLPSVEQARFDTEEAHRNRCHSGTRVEVLSKIRSWARKPTEESLLWLQAPAGTGKSTIARTLQDVFPADSPEKLVAGYFFKRGHSQRNLASLVFSTIASQFVETIPQFDNFLHQSIGNLAAAGNENVIQTKSLDEQVKMLISTPLSELNASGHNDGSIRIIIIDALDECTDLVGIDRVIELLLTATNSQLRLRVIVTSRLTARILDSFQNMEETGISYATIKLHEQFKGETEADIRTFLTKSFERIKVKRKIPQDPWPRVEMLNQAIAHATPLFIYAVTLIRFIEPPGSRILNPTKQLESWFRGCHLNKSHLSDITKMYKLIMECLLYGDDAEAQNYYQANIYPSSKTFWGLLLFSLSPSHVSTWLSKLHAVVHVPSDDTSPVQIIHKSFSDFLVGNGGSEPHCKVNESETHLMLARRCMSRMSAGLHKNICKLKDEGTRQRDIPKVVIVLSILGKLSHAITGIEQLPESAVAHELVNLLKEGRRFLYEFKTSFERFPLQIYGTGLVFSPLTTVLRRLFWDSRVAYIQRAQGETLFVALANKNRSNVPEYQIQVVEVPTGAVRFQTVIDFYIRGLKRVANGKILAIIGDDSGELQFYNAEENTVVSRSDMASNSACRIGLENDNVYMQGRWALHGFGNSIVVTPDQHAKRKYASAGNRLVSAHLDGEFVVLDIDVGLINNI